MPAHRTRALITDPATAVGTCSCGWIGPNRRDLGAARVDANKHQVEAMREAAMDAAGVSKRDTKK